MYGRQESVASGVALSSRQRQHGRNSSISQFFQEMHARLTKDRKKPLWLKLSQRIYHRYGLKHVCLLLVLLAYGFLGAFVFFLIEGPEEERLKSQWRRSLDEIRTTFVHDLMSELFNNSLYVLFIPAWKTKPISHHLWRRLGQFESKLNVTFDPQHKINWDYWNALLFAGTVVTTIGYGHIYPRTNAGRILTCIYAIFGIPLVLTVLNDLGKLLTVGLKFPWFQCKRAFRRVARLCTHTPMEKILDMEKIERENLAIFDLPIPVAVSLVVGWIFCCSATFLVWEKRWSYLEAFYFFFISLSTIGLGDIVPDQPRYLLMMFGFFIIGLSLVSMSVNLIQMRLERTYHAAILSHEQASMLGEEGVPRLVSSPSLRTTLGILQSTTLGIIRSSASMESQLRLRTKEVVNRSCQTDLSFPVLRQTIITGEGTVPTVRLLKPKQRSLTNLFHPASEIRQQDMIRSALANATDAATVIILMGDRSEDADFLMANESGGARGRPAIPRTVSSIRVGEHAVVEVDANRNESSLSISDLDL